MNEKMITEDKNPDGEVSRRVTELFRLLDVAIETQATIGHALDRFGAEYPPTEGSEKNECPEEPQCELARLDDALSRFQGLNERLEMHSYRIQSLV